MNKTTKYVIIGASVIIGMGLVTLIVKRVIRKINEKQQAKRDENLELSLGEKETETEKKETSSAENYNPKADNDLIHGYINGLNVNDYKNEINAIFNRLTDAQVKKLASYWKTKHKGESLYYWLDWELDNCWSPSWNCYDQPMKRLKSLGLL
jgi:hypothetical protein